MPEANLTGFEPHPDNPDWIRLTYADGSSSPYAQDPTGSFRQQAAQLAQTSQGQVANAPSAAAPMAAPAAAPPPAFTPSDPGAFGGSAPGAAGVADFLQNAAPNAPPIAPRAPYNPDASPGIEGAHVAPPEDSHAARTAAGSEDRVAGQRRDAARVDAAYASGAQPYQLAMTAPTGGGVTATSQWQTSGLAPEDRKKVDAANAAAVGSAYHADTEALKARTDQLNNEWERLTEQEKGKLAEEKLRKDQEADFTTKVDAQTKHLQEITARPVDPSLAFQGAGGWYAFMAAFGDAVQNFGAALAGRGPVANPGGHIDSIMERSVMQQTQQQEAMFKAGKITADQLNADRDYVRAQLSTVGKQLADVQLQKARNSDEKAGLGAMAEKFKADRDAAIARNAAATARTQQVGGSKTITPGHGGGLSLFLGEKPDWDSVKALSEKASGADQVERGVGRLEKAAGWTWDEKANNGAGGYIGQDGKPVTANGTDVAGVSLFGSRFSTGEGARELNGALSDMAAGGAKVKDPIGAVSDKSVEAEKEAMAASTDEGILRAAERTRRNLRGMRAGIDSGFSPGVVNAARYRKAAEGEFRNNQPGLPRSRAATADELRGNQ